MSTTFPAFPVIAQGEPETVFENRYLSIRTSPVKFYPSEKDGEYSVVHSGTGLGVVVIMTRRVRGLTYVSLVKQFRFPVNKETVEFPRGGVDLAETYEVAACRELQEETGLSVTAERLRLLGKIHPDTGLMSTEVAVFAARMPEDGTLPDPWVEQSTGASLVWYQAGDFAAAITKGKICDGMTLAAWALYQNSNLASFDII